MFHRQLRVVREKYSAMRYVVDTSFNIRRRAVRAHPNHSHARKWIDATAYLRARGMWVVENGKRPSWGVPGERQ